MNLIKEPLWSLTERMQEIADLISDELIENENAAALEAQLDKIEGEFRAKLEQCASMRRTFQDQAVIARQEAARKERKARIFERAAERLERYMIAQMQAAHLAKAQSPDGLITWSIRQGRGRTIVEDPTALPDELLVAQEPKPDLKKVRQAFDRGVPLSGVHVVFEPWLDER